MQAFTKKFCFFLWMFVTIDGSTDVLKRERHSRAMNGMDLNLMFYISLCVTLFVVIGAGVYATCMVKSAEDYSVGGHRASGTIVTGALIGTLIGGSATIGTAQLAFCVGISAWWFTLGLGVGLIVLALFYAAPLRKQKMVTIAQFLVGHFGEKAGLITSISSSIGIFFSIVASFLASVHLLATVFQLSIVPSILLTAFIILGAVWGGGINGAGLVGILKTVLVYGTLSVGGYGAYMMLGGIDGMRALFPVMPWLRMDGVGTWKAVGDLVALVVGILTTQTYIQAIYSARTTTVAVSSCLTAAAIVIPIGLPAVCIGMFMRIYHPDILPVNALPLYFMEYLPSWLGGAAIMGLLLSSIGSSSGLALGVGTMLSRDLLSRFVNRLSSEKLLAMNRLCVLGVTITASIVTYIYYDALVLTLNLYSMAFRASAIIVPMTLAVFCAKRLTSSEAVVVMLGGLVPALGSAIIGVGISPILFGIAGSGILAFGAMMRNRSRR